MRKLVGLVVLSVVAFGCGDKGSVPATEESPPPTSTVLGMKQLRPRGIGKLAHSGASASAQPMKVDRPASGDVAAANYPEAGVPAIDASCKSPWVVVALSSSDGVAGARDAAIVEQALAANPAFKVVEGEPHAAGEIHVEFRGHLAAAAPAPTPATSASASPMASGAPKASAAPKTSAAPAASSGPAASGSGNFILATCHDAGTCTRFAAMIKAVAKWAPATGCGELDAKANAAPRARVLSATPAKSGDTDALCARLGACKMASDPASTDDPIGACLKSPSSFKTDCAQKATCADVATCLK